MTNKIKCKYIYERGSRIGEICGKETHNEYCSKHSKIKAKNKEKDDNITIVSTVESEEIKEAIKEFEHSVCNTINDDDTNENILLTKYFVFDCIKEFLRDHHEIETILGKKSSGSSFGGMGLAGIALMSLAPILMKSMGGNNLFGNNIDNAIYRQESTTELCGDSRISNNQPTQGSYSTTEREKTITRETTDLKATNESGNDKISPTSYVESIRGPKI